MVNLASVLLGAILLLLGRELYWLFVAIVGFLVGMRIADTILADQPHWLLFLLAVAAGVVGAFLAILAQRLAFALAGFCAGGYLALIGTQSYGIGGHGVLWFVLGGVAGALFAVLIVDGGLIVLSSLVGAGAIVDSLVLGRSGRILVFLLLVIAGILVQTRIFRRGV